MITGQDDFASQRAEFEKAKNERDACKQWRQRAEVLDLALNDICADLVSSLAFDQFMERMVLRAVDALGCEAAAVFQRDGAEWVLSYVYRWSKQAIGTRFADDRFQSAQMSVDAGKPIVSNDCYNDDRLNQEVIRQYKLRSVMVLPLRIGKEVYGCMAFVYHSQPKAFTDLEISFAVKLSAAVSLAVHNIQLRMGGTYDFRSI